MNPVNKNPVNESLVKGSPIEKLPKDIKIHILKHLGAKSLGNTQLVNRTWKELGNNPTRWVELANKFKIKVSCPEKAKEEVTRYYQIVPSVNFWLLKGVLIPPSEKEIISKIPDNLEKNQAIRKFLRENKNDPKVKEEISFLVSMALEMLTRTSTPLFSETLKLFLDEGIPIVTVFNARQSWKPIIYSGNYIEAYKQIVRFDVSEQQLQTELFDIVEHNRFEYAKYFLSQIVDPKKKIDLILFVLMQCDCKDPQLFNFFIGEMKGKNAFMECFNSTKEVLITAAKVWRKEKEVEARAENIKSAVLK